MKALLLLNLIFVTKEEGTMTQSFHNNNKLYILGKIGAADLRGGLNLRHYQGQNSLTWILIFFMSADQYQKF